MRSLSWSGRSGASGMVSWCRGLIGLVSLRHWAQARCFEQIPLLKKARERAIAYDSLSRIETQIPCQTTASAIAMDPEYRPDSPNLQSTRSLPNG